jgi:GntR family transcriptional regulator
VGWLQIDPRSPEPIYLQIVEGVKAAVAKGLLKPGDKMPSVREMAMELTINHNTITKAYQELERERVIEVIRGRGTFIAVEPSVPNREARKEELKEAMRRMLVEAHLLQIDDSELLAMFQKVMDEWRHSTRGVGHELRD